MGKKTVQIRANGRWEDVCPQRVMAGDLFRVLEDGVPVPFPDGFTNQFAVLDASVEGDGSVILTWLAQIKF